MLVRLTSSATSDTEGVFVVEIKGEMATDGDDLAEVAAARFALWWLVGGEAGVDMHGARRCREVESVVILSTTSTG